MHDASSRILTQCPLCSEKYGDTDIRLIEDLGTSRLFHCACASCGNAMLAVVLEASGMVSSVGMVTDQSAADAERFREMPPIGPDFCIAAHGDLEERSFALCQAVLRP